LALLSGIVTINSSAYTASQLLEVGGSPAFIHGANLAWLDGACGHDIGLQPLYPEWGTAYNSTNMSNYLGDMKNMNLNVVRIWLMEDNEGLVFDSNGYVSGLQSIFLTNLDDLVLNIAPSKNIYLYLTLTGSLLNTPHFNIVTDTTARNAYLNNAVAPIIERYKGNNRIFAFDIMNECESDIAGSDGNWGNTGTTWEIMRSFIKDNTTLIHSIDSSRLVTSSSGWHSYNNLQKGYFYGLGLDFYDFHEYRDDGYLPDCSTLNADKPVILGEYGQSSSIRNDTTQNTAASNFLINVRDKGYAGSLIWCYDYPGSTDVHCLLQTDGTWRPVCNTLKNFNPDTTPTPPTYPIQFGTGPAYKEGCEFDKATDGNISTYFDDSNASGGYTGLDYGPDNGLVVNKLRWYPRASWADRMVGGKFQGSNSSQYDGYVDLYTITTTPAYAWNEVTISNSTAYRYIRYLGPTNGYTNVAEVEFLNTSGPTPTPEPTPTPGATPTPIPGSNLLSNPGFETGDFSEWTISGNPRINTTSPYSGAYCADLYKSGGGISKIKIVGQTIPVTAGSTYKFSAMLRSSSGTGYMEVLNGSTVIASTSNSTSSWTLKTLSITAPSGASHLTFRFRVEATGTYVDDAELTLN
jgi:hypothetical protein